MENPAVQLAATHQALAGLPPGRRGDIDTWNDVMSTGLAIVTSQDTAASNHGTERHLQASCPLLTNPGFSVTEPAQLVCSLSVFFILSPPI